VAKGYLVTTYRSITNLDHLVEYARLAGPAMETEGGRFLVRGTPSKSYESGINLRTIVIEFDSVERAVAAFESDGYQTARRALGNGAERDIRIVEGV
jgi:uncharacterized protein (DUF1330 family)